MATLSHVDRTAGRLGGRHPRRPGWKRRWSLWVPDLDALTFHARWRGDGVDIGMSTHDEGHDRVSRLAGGFNRTARDFDRAIHLARLSSSQLLLVQRAREQSWSRPQIEGRTEPEPFRLNLSEIAGVAGLDRSGLSRQQAALVARRIFLDLGDGGHIINKDYRTWVDASGSPLLNRAQIHHCKQVRRKVRPVDSGLQSVRLQSTGRICGGVDSSLQAVRLQSTPAVDSSLHPVRLQSTGPQVRPVDSSLQSEGGPIEERAGTRAGAPAESERLRESERLESLSSPTLSPKTGGLAESDRGEVAGDQATKTNPPDDAEAAVAWTLERVGRAYPGDESILEVLPMWVRSWMAEGHALVAVQDAVIKAVAKVRRASGLVGYIKSCLDSRARSATHRVDPAHESLPGPRETPSQARHRRLMESFDRWEEDQKGVTDAG